MKFDYFYVVNPKEEFKKLVISKLGQSHQVTRFLLMPEIWKRPELDMSGLSTQQKKAQAKLMFLISLKDLFTYDPNLEGITSSFTFESFRQIFGDDFDISLSTFDKHWTIERTNRTNNFIPMMHSLTKDELEEIVTGEMQELDEWIEDLKIRLEEKKGNGRPHNQ